MRGINGEIGKSGGMDELLANEGEIKLTGGFV